MLNTKVKDAVLSVFYAKPCMETMGERIRRLRGAKNLTQDQLARQVGVTKSAVSQWEDDSTKNIKLTTFLALVEVLGTDVAYLIYGDSRSPPGTPSASGRPRSVRRHGT